MGKPKLYRLMDHHPERKWAASGIVDGNVMAVNSREFRCPKKGEWYLSGAIPGAYKAPNDLSMEFWIATLVRVKILTEYVLEELD